MRAEKWMFPVLTLLGASALSAVAAETKVVIVVGPSDHPPGTHEVSAGARLLKWALEHMGIPGFEAEVVHEWPKQQGVLDTAATIVFIGDLFPPHRMPDGGAILEEIGTLMNRGVGIACLHHAAGLPAANVPADGAHPLLGWMGGYFAPRNRHHRSFARVFDSVTVSPATAAHAVSRGWREFTVPEEPYYNNYFGPDGNKLAPNVTALATAMVPPEAPRSEVVAWGIERNDGGRGFGVVMPHYYKNWAHEDIRRLILNGIVWTAKREVPAGGVRTATPDLAAFGQASVEPQPRTPAPRPN